MIRRSASALRALVMCALGATAGSAFSQVLPSDLRLTFTQPTGVFHPNESVEVYVTLTNTGTQAFLIDNTQANLGLHPSLLPANGYYTTGGFPPYTVVPSTYSSYTGARVIGDAPACARPVSTGCWPEYGWLQALSSPALPLAPGASTTFLLGTLFPHFGYPPAPGTYSLGNVGVSLLVDGRDAEGHFLNGALSPQLLASTCGNLSDAACAAAGLNFTRTLVAVPEPAPAVLLAMGIAALALRRRR